jgi:hypothetical protein
MRAAVLAGLEGAEDVGVAQAHGQASLAPEAGQHQRVGGPGRRQHLDGDGLAFGVDGLVDAGQAAAADAAEDPVRPEGQGSPRRRRRTAAW